MEHKNYVAPDVTENMRIGPDPILGVLNPTQHKKLATHLLRLCARADHKRKLRIASMEAIETDLLGLVVADADDCKRKQNREEGRGAAVPDAIYPYGYLQLQELATQVAAVVFPAEAPYAVAAGPEAQEKATALVRAFRHMGHHFDHRNSIHAAIFDAMALDMGVLEYKWDKIRSMGQPNSPAGTATALSYMEGMRIRVCDPYNVSYDPAVRPEDVPLEGQFIAKYMRVSPFSLRRGYEQDSYLSPDLLEKIEKRLGLQDDYATEPQAAESISTMAPAYGNLFYHQSRLAATRAEILQEHGSNRRSPATDMSGIFSGAMQENTLDCENSVHKIVMYVRLQPNAWGLRRDKLSKADRAREPFSVWEVHLIDQGYISYAVQLDVEADRLPMAVATTNYSKHEGRAFQLGGHAAQMGLYASMLLNFHKRAMRKGLDGGLTIFNPDVVPLNSADDVSSGRIPIKMNRHDDSISRHIVQLNDTPDTAGNLRDAGAILDLMRSFLPANAQPAMAGLDRATQYQAQAVMTTSMQQSLWYGALFDGQLMVPARFFLHYYTIKHAPRLPYFDETKQQMLQLEGTELKQLEFSMLQSQPLMGVDRLRQEIIVRDMVNILLQAGDQVSPVAAELLKYYVQVSGATLDMQQFEDAIRQAQEAAQAEAGPTPPGPANGIPQDNPAPTGARAPITATRG